MFKRAMAPVHHIFAVFLFFHCSGLYLKLVNSVDHYYTIDVKFAYTNADGFDSRLIFSGNGTFPGPTIRATQGDILHVTIVNELFQEGTTIHWHGIKQQGTPYYDGVAGVSQCAILPGTNMTYVFNTSGNLGTHWWHSHYVIQLVAALYGPLIIDPPPPFDDKVFLGYDEELEPAVMLGDWYHTTLNDQEYSLLNVNGWLWPSTGIVNGKGIFNCTPAPAAPCIAANISANYTVLKVTQGKRYRMRIINSASQAFYNFVIENHNLTIVEADGNYVEPVVVTSLDLSAGQTYSVLFTADQPIDTYWMVAPVQYVSADFDVNAIAILQYEGAPELEPLRELPSTHPAWNDTAFSNAQLTSIKQRADSIVPVSTVVDRHITIVLAETIVNGIYMFSVNNKTLQLPPTPYYLQQYYGVLNDTIDYSHDQPSMPYNYMLPLPAQNITEAGDMGTIMYTINRGDVIQVVLQNTVNDDLLSTDHPWHLHGHDFWVVGTGFGIYNASLDAEFNLESAVWRNTATVLPLGWTAIRFVADNPGIWLFHCHNSLHPQVGMGVVFNEIPSEHPPPPPDAALCGDVTPKFLQEHAPGGTRAP